MAVLEPDTTLRLPGITVLKASAGSGKTFALTQRYVQFLLSERVPRNKLSNMLAITFSNNASREMRENVLEWLKKLHFRDPDRLAQITAVTAGGEEHAAQRAGELIEEILSRYSDFQVRTIDSFMATVFRASALDFGYSPEFEIVMDAEPLVDYAFNLFLRDAAEGSDRARLLDETVRTVLGFKRGDDRYSWDPTPPLLAGIKKLDAELSMLDERPAVMELRPRMRELEAGVRQSLERVARLIETSGLALRVSSPFPILLSSVRAGRFSDLVSRSMKTCPVRKPTAKDAAALSSYEEISSAWADADERVGQYVACWARAYYQPYLRLHTELEATVEKVKRGQAKVVIGDISRALGQYLTNQIVPDIYFRIGERVWHFLIDELQDTSPLQWRNLYPLVENSLAMGGSLFVVGDTKQAIYGFRQADYTIMRSLEAQSPFPSAPRQVRELDTSWRSTPRVLELASEVFRRNAAAASKYSEAARRSGLDDWTQKPRTGDDPGYVEIQILQRDDKDPPERRKLRQLMEELRSRGYRWGDIAILASKNEQVVQATSWLNEMDVPFISFSSLDVRSRRIAGEMLALLAFLDSPPDDLAFATFLLGDIFTRSQARRGAAEGVRELLFRCRGDRPLYKAFQRERPELWSACFAGLFRSAGYLPLYDLVSEAYARLDVFSLAPEEEATLAKLLEAVKDFEGSGSNSLREFLSQAAGDSAAWDIAVPRSSQSVRAMTVHKAKGLGFPVVIALLYGESSRGFEYSVLREETGIVLVKLTQPIAARDPSLLALYQEEAVKEQVNRLNGLYVELTRAKREMYVIGVKRERDTFPFDLLPASAFQPSDRKGKPGVEAPAAEAGVTLSHESRPVPVSFGAERLGRQERRRGELVHRMLELTVYAEPAGYREAETTGHRGAEDGFAAALRAAGARAAREARADPAEAGAAAVSLAGMISGTELAAYFSRSPGRVVLVEQEFCDKEGRLFRMDRIVVDPDRVTVIDFKTGAKETGSYDEDIRAYARLLQEAYPGRAVEALIAFVDIGVIRRID